MTLNFWSSCLHSRSAGKAYSLWCWRFVSAGQVLELYLWPCSLICLIVYVLSSADDQPQGLTQVRQVLWLFILDCVGRVCSSCVRYQLYYFSKGNMPTFFPFLLSTTGSFEVFLCLSVYGRPKGAHYEWSVGLVPANDERLGAGDITQLVEDKVLDSVPSTTKTRHRDMWLHFQPLELRTGASEV